MQQERGSQPFPFLQKTFLLKHIVGVISGQSDEVGYSSSAKSWLYC